MNLAEQLRKKAESDASINKEEIRRFLEDFFTNCPQLSIECYGTNIRDFRMEGYMNSRWSMTKQHFAQLIPFVKELGFIWDRCSDNRGFIRLYP